jgi:hypothetical protein
MRVCRCGDSGRLPSSHTCFNQLDLPEYPSSDVLQRCLLSAIREGFEGFGEDIFQSITSCQQEHTNSTGNVIQTHRFQLIWLSRSNWTSPWFLRVRTVFRVCKKKSQHRIWCACHDSMIVMNIVCNLVYDF